MNSSENEIKFCNYIIDKVIKSNGGGDLKELQELVQADTVGISPEYSEVYTKEISISFDGDELVKNNL